MKQHKSETIFHDGVNWERWKTKNVLVIERNF